MNNKWIRAAVPALLIHCSIGTVYCWSTFKEAIAMQIGASTFATGWAFSLAIFFLGMSAAFAGRIVEADIHRSSLISCICFTTGMLGTGFVIQHAHGILALIGIYFFYGCIMGIGLGVGYLTPVKTLMLWFSDQKGLATGISIMGFGLAKAIATPIMEFLQNRYGISAMFYILGCIYFVMMLAGHFLLKKPDGWVENPERDQEFQWTSLLKNKTFVGIWLIFFLNIHCGLMLITYEKQILNATFAGLGVLALIISFVPSVTAACNALGRIGYSTISDRMKDRSLVYQIIFGSCFTICAVVLLSSINVGTVYKVVVVIMLMIINLGYGGGFSTLPALLSSRFGMDHISKIHGITLSAWAVAGVTGNNTSEMILKASNQNYNFIISVALLLYVVAFFICVSTVKEKHL
ncbi:MAG: OFA family MFS transporter [Lachnospiraceae bacterium]|nr:OFA family MFS transporter [Lachnospiraceae bacterium]